MKKFFNIAVIVSGIDEYYQNSILKGIRNYALSHNINLVHFIAFGGVMADTNHDTGEYNIFSLPDFAEFDGAILLTNTISSSSVSEKIISKIKQAGIPAVSIDNNISEFYHIGIDNSDAMRRIVEHFVNHHGFKTFNYISGPENNPESIQRFETFKSTLKKYNLPFDEKRIYFGDFRSLSGHRAAEYFLDSELSMPDVIISANDVMAISAMSVFEERGFKIPDDVAFSGFDDTYNARNYSPELTSVKRPLEESGFIACEKIYKHLNGEATERSIILDMNTRFTESCSCNDIGAEKIEDYKKNNYHILENNNVSLSLINRMSCQLIDCDSIYEYIESLKSFVLEIKADEFYLCLCDDWNIDVYSNSYESKTNVGFTIEGYTDKITVPVSMKNGIFYDPFSFNSKIMLPKLFNDSEKNKIYYFVPLHFRERCLGYIVILNSDFPVESPMFQTWCITISNTLENIRKLECLDRAIKKLDRLYTIDTLSEIYNRNGFKNNTEKLFDYCIKRKKPVMLMFIDMDGLKFINDTYGHKAGDRAIKAMADSIKKSCTNGEVYCRFGGDEFIIFAPDYSDSEAKMLTEAINKNIALESDDLKAEYTLGASIGYHIQVPDPDTQLFQLVTIADNIMYNEKKKKKSKYLKSDL